MARLVASGLSYECVLLLSDVCVCRVHDYGRRASPATGVIDRGSYPGMDRSLVPGVRAIPGRGSVNAGLSHIRRRQADATPWMPTPYSARICTARNRMRAPNSAPGRHRPRWVERERSRLPARAEADGRANRGVLRTLGQSRVFRLTCSGGCRCRLAYSSWLD